jgi:pyrimidine-nucleoside phosphorylase
VGDSVTLVAAPLAAALGVRVAKTSGHGLGHTGGTLDKLEAIPGMRVDLPLERFVRQVRDVGIAVVGQSDRLVPADRRLYALRDQTGTVSGAALVAGSVMSKKIAGGAQALVLDVKAGGGAFFADADRAREAAELMADIARPWGRRVRWLVTDMEQPAGAMVGNALEVRQCGEVLRGAGPAPLRDLAVTVAGELAEAAGVVADGEGADAAAAALRTGAALATAERWVEAQGGDPAVWTAPERLPAARMREEVRAARAGVVARVDARTVGEAARWLGAGRLSRGQVVDPAVGVEVAVRVGDRVAAGDLLAVVHAQDAWLAGRAVGMVAEAVALGDDPVPPRPLVLARGRG